MLSLPLNVLLPTAVSAQAGASPYTTGYRWDAMRRLVGTIGPDPDGSGPRAFLALRYTYDADGQLIRTEKGVLAAWQAETVLPFNWAGYVVQEQLEITYDAVGNKVEERFSGSNGLVQRVSQMRYDANDRLQCSAMRMNFAATPAATADHCSLGTTGPNGPDRITKLTYNAASELIKTTVAFGTAQQADEETNTYTLNGKLASVTDGENNKTTFEYDGHDRLSKTRYPVAAVGANASSTTDYEQLSYDANGNVTQRRLRDGLLHNFTYDALNRQTLKDVPYTSYYDLDISTTYDLLGRPISISNTNDVVTNSYDALGRKLTETSAYGTKTMTYDAAGRRTSLSYPGGGLTINYDYDMTGNMLRVRENGATSGVGVLASYAYDNLGRRLSITRGNGTVTSTAYDGIGRLSSLAHDSAGSMNDVMTTLAYNPASQITTYTRDNDSFRWNGHYNISRPYGTNGLNQLTTAGATPLGYDGRGNLISSGSLNYGYNSSNQLNSTYGVGGELYIRHDPLGRLLLVYTSPTQQTYFDHDGSEMIAEYNASGGLLRRYVHGPSEDDPLVWYEGSGTTDRRWLHTDERGSITGYSNSAGTLAAINSYDEYGIPAATNVGRFQYTGQAWLPELGLYYYKARIYSPTLGRFMQTDPIGYQDGVNWYDYVDGDPVNRSDPDGQEGMIITGAGIQHTMNFMQDPLDTLKTDAVIASLFVAPELIAVRGLSVLSRTLGIGQKVTRGGLVGVGRGRFAREAIPAKPGRPTAAQQRDINRIGQTNGCHTCGSKNPGTKSGNFVGDHQPPTKLNPPGGKQEFLPHCQGCSNVQGGRVSQMPVPPLPPPPSKSWWKFWQ